LSIFFCTPRPRSLPSAYRTIPRDHDQGITSFVLNRFVFEFGYMTTRNPFRPPSPALNTMLFRDVLLPFLGFSFICTIMFMFLPCRSGLSQANTRLLFLSFQDAFPLISMTPLLYKLLSQPLLRWISPYEALRETVPFFSFHVLLSHARCIDRQSLDASSYFLLHFPLSLAFDS